MNGKLPTKPTTNNEFDNLSADGIRQLAEELARSIEERQEIVRQISERTSASIRSALESYARATEDFIQFALQAAQDCRTSTAMLAKALPTPTQPPVVDVNRLEAELRHEITREPRGR